MKSFQVAQLVYDVTVRFCDRYIDKRSRTHDQMVQAARSGVQNIAEGSQASGTSKKFELKLTSVARASLEELKLDYEDFLRHRGLEAWPRDDQRRAALIDRRPKTADEVADWVREVKSGKFGHSGQGAVGGQSKLSTVSTPSTASFPEIAANGALALITVATSLLDIRSGKSIFRKWRIYRASLPCPHNGSAKRPLMNTVIGLNVRPLLFL